MYLAEQHSRAQSDRAKKKRNQIDEDGTTIKDVIQQLVFNPEHSNLKAKELWPYLYSALEEAGAAPRDNSAPQDPNLRAYKYENYRGVTKAITFRNFENILSKVRKSR